MATSGEDTPSSLEFTLSSLAVGDTVWVSDATDAFVPASVTAIDDSAVHVRISTDGSEVKVPKVVPKRRTSKSKRGVPDVIRLLPREDGEALGDEGVENMDNLTHLHE